LCPEVEKFGLTTRALCAVLPEQDTLQGTSANPHGHATTLLAGTTQKKQPVMLDFFLWGHLKDLVYQEPIRDFHHLQQQIRHCCDAIQPDTKPSQVAFLCCFR
jgi:hypothetical protein